MKSPNFVITKEELEDYKNGKKVKKLEKFWGELKSSALQEIIREFLSKDLELEELPIKNRFRIKAKEPFTDPNKIIDTLLPFVFNL